MLHKLTIGQRLGLLIVFLLCISVFLGGYGMHTQHKILSDFSSTYHDRVVPLQQLKSVADGYAVSIVDAAHKVAGGSVDKETFLDNMDKARRDIAIAWRAYHSTFLTEEESQLAQEAERRMKAADVTVDRLRQIVLAGDAPALQAFNNTDLYPAIDPVGSQIATLIDLQLKVAARDYEQSEADARLSDKITVALIVIGVMLGAGVAYTIIRHLLRQLGGEPKDVVALAERIAKGDLSQKLLVGAGDQGSIVASMSAMQQALISLMHHLDGVVDRLTVNATELAAASGQVAVGAEEQTRSAAAMAASIEQLSVSISSVNDSAQEVSSEAMSSDKLAHEGQAIIDRTLQTIQDVTVRARDSQQQADVLGTKSQQISNVVQVIRDVAEQTNLLALNAAIEAARAGEQGRGFAVVADEVRKLSERTSQSTAEIGGIISEMVASSQHVVADIHDTVEQMEEGLSQTRLAREAVIGISSNVDRINQSVGSISAALAQQQSASSGIAGTVEQVAQMSEETSSAAAQTAASAGQLEQMAHEIKTAIDFFILPGAGAARHETPGTAARMRVAYQVN